MMHRGIQEHVEKLAKSGKRLDGRSFTEYRQPISVETGVIKTAEGSARVKIGKTELIVGVKVEIMKPYPDSPDQGSIMVGAELLPLSSPDFESGPPGIQAVELARVVDRGIRESKSVDFKKLCIEKGEKAWMLVLDICTINDDGNLFDASSLAAIAALKDMRFPKVEDGRIVFKEKTNTKLTIKDTPLSVTVHKMANVFIVDPISDEEKVSEARLTVASLSDGTLCALQKGGDAPLSAEDINQMVDIAIEKGKELRKLIPK